LKDVHNYSTMVGITVTGWSYHRAQWYM